MNFEDGKQPCEDFVAEVDEFGLTNLHECFCPFDKTHPCDLKVSWCVNCHKDHHDKGYDNCKGCN